MLSQQIIQIEHEDSPYFSDTVLLPAIARGQRLTLITGFIPSYLLRLVADLVASREIEPGKIKIILCVPNNFGGDALDISSAIAKSKISAEEAEAFAIDTLRLSDEGSLDLEVLVSDKGGLLTFSAIGQISDDFESATFIDRLAGDNNSPLRFSRSWSEGAEKSANLAANQFVDSALGDTFSGIRRLSSSQTIAAIRDVAKNNLLSAFFTSDTNVVPSTHLQVTDEEIEAELNELAELEQDLILDYDETIVGFFPVETAGVRDLTWYLDDPKRLNAFKSHAPPMPDDILTLVGTGHGQCWCGNPYDREFGCSGNE